DRCEVVPGVGLIVLDGPTSEMLGERLSSGGQIALFLSDLVPTTSPLPLPWIMGFDLYPMTTLENKKKWLPQIVREGWLALFCHDGKIPAARLREQEGKIVAEPVVVDGPSGRVAECFSGVVGGGAMPLKNPRPRRPTPWATTRATDSRARIATA